jgi:uncharacterized protein YlzI (FlbEa/FlbD family)
MKLVKIDSDLYLNSDFIESVEADGEGSTDITMKNGEVFSPNVSIKKVLDAISGSEEHLVNDADMKILKSKSITSGHLNQSFDRF